MFILEFLLKNKALVAMAILALALAGQSFRISLLKSSNKALEAEKAAVQTLLETSQANLKQLQGEIKVQNDAIEKLKKEGDERVAKNAEEVKKAQAVAETYKKKAEDLMNRKAPQNLNKCDAANALINEEIRNARK